MLSLKRCQSMRRSLGDETVTVGKSSIIDGDTIEIDGKKVPVKRSMFNDDAIVDVKTNVPKEEPKPKKKRGRKKKAPLNSCRFNSWIINCCSRCDNSCSR